jgi:hypothetical protein
VNNITDPVLLEELRSLHQEKKQHAYMESSVPHTPVTDPVLLSELRGEDHTKDDWLEDPMMASRAILDGFFYGFSDEIGASVAAGMAKVFEPELTKDKSFGQVRSEMIGTLEEQQADWARENPALSVGLNVAGAIGSGTMAFKGAQALGKGLATAPGIQPVVQAVQQRRLSSALQRAATTPAPATVLEASIAAQPAATGGLVQAAKKALPYTPLLAAEGGLAGAGYAEQGADLGEAALTGAATGVALGLPMITGLNYVLNGMSKNRLAQQLGQKEDFVPLSIALREKVGGSYERTVGWAYNKFINNTFGGESLLEQQTKRTVSRADSTLAKEQVKVNDAISLANKKLAEAKNKANVDEQVSKIKTQAEETAIVGRFDEKLARQKAKADATKEADAAVNAANAAFRVNLHLNSLPVNAPKELVAEVANTLDPQLRQRLINEAWGSDYTFSMLKNRSFRFNQQQLAQEIETVVNDELAALSPKLTGGEPIGDFIISFLGQKTNRQGYITGEELTRIRTELSRIANQFPDQGPGAVQGVQIRRLVDVINDKIETQLKGSAKEAFKQEKLRWKTNLASRNSVLSSTKVSGNYLAEDYLASLQKLYPKDAQQKLGPFQREAEQLRDTNKRVNDQIMSVAEEATEAAKRSNALEVAKQKNKVEAQIKALQKRQKQKELSAQQRADAEIKLAEANERLASLKQYTTDLKDLETASDTSPFMKFIYTSILGGGFNPLAGVGVSAALSTPQAQRALVGQTGIQQMVARGMQKQPIEKLAALQAKIGDRGAMGAEQGSIAGMDVLMSESDARKVKAYNRLSASGRLADLQRLNPKVYKSLLAAVEKQKAR